MNDVCFRIGTMAFVLATAACAHTAQVGPESKIQASSEPAPAPTLVGCTGYTPTTFHWTEANRVSIRMKVQADGTVEASSLQHTPSRFDRGGHDAVQRAMSLAQGCVFEPAYEDEKPVEAWTSVRFAFG